MFIIYSSYYSQFKIFPMGFRIESLLISRANGLQNVRFLAFSVPQKVNCVTWYTKTKFFYLTQQICRRTYHKILPSPKSISRWVQNFGEHGTMEIHSRPGRHSMMFESNMRISDYSNKHPRTSLKTAETRSGLPMSSIE